MVTGKPARFEYVPYRFSQLLDHALELWGEPALGEQVVYRGQVAAGSFSAWWLDAENRPVASLEVRRPPEERELSAALIAAGHALDPDLLRNAHHALATLAGDLRPADR
ncbi:MAG: hypothetical protein HC915_11590 [Anaerolineae bacterium]|nr:hypothetical protein [Anaerolineae bacterium]